MNRKEIRILELLPGRFGKQLQGELRTISLYDTPPYEPLSYAWGESSDEKTITLLEGNRKLVLRHDLYRALQRLRHRLRSWL